MPDKRRIFVVLLFLKLNILIGQFVLAKGGNNGESSKTKSKELCKKFDKMEIEIANIKQLMDKQFYLILVELHKLQVQMKQLNSDVLKVENTNQLQAVNVGMALQVTSNEGHKKNIAIEHSQQLGYSGDSKHNREEFDTKSGDIVLPNNKSINSWDPNECNEDLSIIDSDHLVVLHKGTFGCRSVFAKWTVQRQDGIFYYEVTIVKERGPLFIGLANKSTMSVDGWVGYAPGSYAYSSGGHLFGHTVKEEIRPPNKIIRPIDTTIPFGANDIIGCGVNLMTKQIIYTKNGVLLDTTDLTVSSTDLFPCVSLLSPGDKIEANFGPDFTFNSLLKMIE
ncbi:hypothetical protein GPALN_010569 [Globodera pallida]|nr:hypothetical protein GPALN_010569 [Globodera pallida]